MPTSGTATYQGAAAYSSTYSTAAGLAAYATTVSDVELLADFANSTISGTADNFKTSVAGVSLSGGMNVNGSITNNTFSAAVAGTVTESGANLTVPVAYSGSVNGEFVGANAEGLRGLGSATGDAGIYGSQNVYVLFGAERQ